MKHLFFLLILGLTVVSCLPEETEAINLDEELIPYFDRFSEEAAIRGFSFDWKEDRIEGYIGELTDEKILGQCIHDNLDPNSVIISETFWNNSGFYDKEFIVFHELGHCFLNRNHNDDTDETGMCTSIMNSGSQACRANYGADTRDEYLDELFTL